MTQKIVYDDAVDVIRVAVEGEMTLDGKPDLVDTFARLKSEYSCNRILMNLSKVKKTPSVTHLYEFAGKLPFDLYIGLMVGSNNNADFIFLENTSMNRGRNVRIFVDEEQALSWLNASGKLL
jgi:hypothetical protein